LDCVKQARRDRAMGLPELLVPLELQRHVFAGGDGMEEDLWGNTDGFGDSFARDTSVQELTELLGKMNRVEKMGRDAIEDAVKGFREDGRLGWMFMHAKLFFDPPLSSHNHVRHRHDHDDANKDEEEEAHQKLASLTARFAGATVADFVDDDSITHVVVHRRSDARAIRERLAQHREKIPRVVGREWIEESWREGTRLDEERFLAS
jgi:DNA ligase 4